MSVEYDKVANILSAQTRSIAQNSIGNTPLSLKLSGITSSEVMYIEFNCPKGIKYVSKLIDIAASGLVGYEIPFAITKNVGEVFAQLIFRDKVTGVEVAKSLISATPLFVVEKSVNATDIIPDTVKQDLVSNVTASVNNMNGLRDSILAEKNAGAFNGAKGDRGDKGDKGEQGIKGDRGDKGEAGSPLSTLNAYPVGSIYQSINATSPQILFGGTWQQLVGDAYIKIVTANAGSYGGTPSHKIGLNNMPSHDHLAYSTGSGTCIDNGNNWLRYNTTHSSDPGHNVHRTDFSGDSEAYYPHYYGVYTWVRKA